MPPSAIRSVVRRAQLGDRPCGQRMFAKRSFSCFCFLLASGSLSPMQEDGMATRITVKQHPTLNPNRRAKMTPILGFWERINRLRNPDQLRRLTRGAPSVVLCSVLESPAVVSGLDDIAVVRAPNDRNGVGCRTSALSQSSPEPDRPLPAPILPFVGT